MRPCIESQLDFKKFFEDFFPGVYSLLKKYTGEGDVSWDLAQEAFVKLYEKRVGWEDVESAKAFVYTIARNLFINYYRREKLKVDIHARLEYEEMDTHDFLNEVTAEETLRLLYAAINQLPSQTRTIILLNLKGKNNNEIAEELGVSVNTIKTLKKLAYRTLRELLQKEYWLLLFILCESQA